VKLACDMGAWACGFIMAPSPRRLTTLQVAKLRESVTPGVLAVGVFVEAQREQILMAIRDCHFDLLQFAGKETPSDCLGYPVPVMKVLPPEAGAEAMKLYDVARFLVEPPRHVRDEASLRKCWEFAGRARAHSIVLAGGLTPENVGEAVKIARPYAVDVSSGIESAPGVKDAEKLEKFFFAAT
jgi:phosphoribosylanthranilate isomerase